jgi:small subunit ribosomal protein S3Ae
MAAPGSTVKGSEKKKAQPTGRSVKDKWRSKVWVKLRAPGLFQGLELGETLATEPTTLVGRTLEVTQSDLGGMGDPSKAHVKLRFRISSVNADARVAETRYIGHLLTSDYIRRLARRKRSKIDLSFHVVSKDGVEMVLKPLAVSEHRLQAKLQGKLRARLKEVLVKAALERTAGELVRDLLNGDLSKVISQGVHDLYPLKKVEIRASEVLGPMPESTPAVPSGPEPPVPSAPLVEPAASAPAAALTPATSAPPAA